MSAALQFASPAVLPVPLPGRGPEARPPVVSLAFYRKHTRALLKRYLYASMLVGRSPALLREPLCRGMVSYQPVQSFEDGVIFVLDMEKCFGHLGELDRILLGKIVLQEYEASEVALLLKASQHVVEYALGGALDRLTRILLDAGILVLPHS